MGIRKKKYPLNQLIKDLKFCKGRSSRFGLRLSKKSKIILGLGLTAVASGTLLYILLEKQKKLEQDKAKAKTLEELKRIMQSQYVKHSFPTYQRYA